MHQGLHPSAPLWWRTVAGPIGQEVNGGIDDRTLEHVAADASQRSATCLKDRWTCLDATEHRLEPADLVVLAPSLVPPRRAGLDQRTKQVARAGGVVGPEAEIDLVLV